VRFGVEFASAKTIDEKGITYAVRSCISKGVQALAPDPLGHTVLLDGLLRAPKQYAQHTIIGGDATEPIISLASIAAKVRRDRLMQRLAKQYPGYGFEQHKGYATPKHYEAIEKLGLCEIHRRTYGLDELAKSIA
jgi:ribonuclease HII